jgi:hypothetical protein
VKQRKKEKPYIVIKPNMPLLTKNANSFPSFFFQLSADPEGVEEYSPMSCSRNQSLYWSRIE